MIRHKSGKWLAVRPTDLIGWEIVTDHYDERKGLHLLVIKLSNSDEETHEIYATEAAIPLIVLQRFGK